MERAHQDEQNGTTKNVESQIDAGLNVSNIPASDWANALLECLPTGPAELGAKTTLGVPNKTGEEASEDKGEEVRQGEQSSGLESWKPAEEESTTKFAISARGRTLLT